MKLKLYKYKLEDEALIILNQDLEIISINDLAKEYFKLNSYIDINILEIIENKTGIVNIRELVERSLEQNMQIKIQAKDDKALLIKSLILHEKSLLSIFVFQKMKKKFIH